MACNCSKLPPVHRIAANAAGAVVRAGVAAVAGNAITAPLDEVKRRMDICKQCDKCVEFQHKTGATFHRCRLCGCWLDGKYLAKARLATETCPDGRWHNG